MFFTICFLVALETSSPLFETVETWEHNQFLGGFFFDAEIDGQGALILQAWKEPLFGITSKRVFVVRPKGNGPEDLSSSMCFSRVGTDLAVYEHVGNIKVFKYESSGFRLQRLIKVAPLSGQIYPTDLVQAGSYWFIGGVKKEYDQNDRPIRQKNVKAVDDEGKFVTWLVERPLPPHPGQGPFLQMADFFLKLGPRYIYFLADDYSMLYVIDPNQPAVIQKKPLPKPPGFVPIPGDAYSELKMETFLEEMWRYRLSYSRVTNMALTDRYLIVQSRNITRPDQGRFDLAIFDLETLTLKARERVNDYLLTANNNKVYFFRNGNPWHEDDAGDLIIDIKELRLDNEAGL